MDYLLQYFEELIEINTIEYHRGNKGALDHEDVSNEINRQTEEIEKALRCFYYSPSYENRYESFFRKLAERILYLLKNVESNIYSIQRLYILDNRSFVFNQYQNYHFIHHNLCRVYRMFVDEFKLDGVAPIPGYLGRKRDEELYQDYMLIRRFLSEDSVVPLRLVNDYGLKDYDLDLIRENLWPSQEELIKEKLSSGYNNSSYFFLNFYRIYLTRYERYGKPEHRFFYSFVKDKLKEDVSTLKSKEEKLLYIEDFFLHTDLCADLVVDYFEEKIEKILYNDEKIEKEFKNLENRLTFIKENPRHRNYHASRLMEVQKRNVDLVLELLGDSKKSLGMDTDEKGTLAQAVESSQSSNAEPKQIKLLEADGRKYLSEKIEYNGTADSLGLLFALFFESGLIKSKNQKARVARILSVSFNAGGDSFSHDTILKAFKDPLSNQKSVKYVEEKLREIKVQLAQLKAK